MAGIMEKIGEKLHMGGHKEGHEHKPTDEHHKHGDHVEKKEGLVEKIKDKIHGEGEHNEGEKKKKKEKKKHEKGHDHGDSSSSDSD